MRLRKPLNIFGQLLFWGWNLLFLFLCVFLIGMAVLPFVLVAGINGEIPLSILLCLLILMVTPLYAIWFGIKNNKNAVAFFFGVEIPIIILTLFRIFIVRELTLGSGFLLLTALIALGVFAWSLHKKPQASTPVPPTAMSAYGSTIFHTIVLITGCFVAVISALYALPLAIDFIKGFFSFNWLGEFRYFDILAFIMIGIFLLGCVAFFVFPLYISYFYPSQWKKNGRRLAPTVSKAKYGLVSLVTAVIWAGLFLGVSHQEHADYVSQLSNLSFDEQKTEMQNPDEVRKRLLKAYLNEYRYLGTKEESTNLFYMYKRSLGSEFLGRKAQDLQSLLIRPLLYKGSPDDGDQAGKLYTELFDSKIQRDEQKAITKALEATFNRDEVVAGLMNIGARNVIIREQNIDITQQDNFAVIEIEEVYENLTFENQEIFYYFSLPEDAAITGIWIGQTDKREEMDAFIVAPRGAAQKVYEEQVRRNIDPALLEQVGPGQYRLRVFPIPVTRGRAQFTSRRSGLGIGDDTDDYMRVHMRYVVPKGLKKSVLPALLEKRNVDWSKKTQRRLNGKSYTFKTDWMPKHELSSETGSQGFTTQIGDKLISLRDITDDANLQAPDRALGKIAVIVDTSYSMRKHKTHFEAALGAFDTLNAKGQASFDYFVMRANGQSMARTAGFEAEGLDPFGRLNTQDMLIEFQANISTDQYAAILMLTDQGVYGENDAALNVSLKAPLYMLHMDKLAPAYDDNILDLIYRTGGGVSNSVSDVIRQMTQNSDRSRMIGDRLWTYKPAMEASGIGNSPMARSPEARALAARQLILMASFGEAPSVTDLDDLHEVAKTHEVISPYSSMIVLVNERQKEALKKASEADDRFEREGRSGEEILNSPNSPLVSGVPEPHEWLLIFVSVILLLWLWRRRDDWDNGGRSLLG